MQVHLEPHPLLELGLVSAELPASLGELATPDWLLAMLSPEPGAARVGEDETRAESRNLLRPGGYKPTGRGKPASEYLARAVAEGSLTSINLVVDVNNAVSLAAGLAISVVDSELATPPLSVARGREGESYVFNTSGQEIRLDNLLCLRDAEGPCANAVRDSQRTKTHDGTRRLLFVVWGTSALEGRTELAVEQLRGLLTRAGAEVSGSAVLAAPRD